MQREIITTADGSHSIAIEALQVAYHSKHGALQESNHIFIQEGLQYYMAQHTHQPIHILEMGFGTGLNALLTAQYASKHHTSIIYTGIEKYPLQAHEYNVLNYGSSVNDIPLFNSLHKAAWQQPVCINNFFTLIKQNIDVNQFTPIQNSIDIIYYDAFAPAAQPELWTADIFLQLYNALTPAGILVTYCSKSYVQKNMLQAGFSITKPKGPIGKREMLRATKPTN